MKLKEFSKIQLLSRCRVVAHSTGQANTHTHTPICMFHVNQQRRWSTSKSSFSRQCVARIRDTCSQLTWKSHSLHTHGGTFWPTLTPAQTLHLHESCQNKHKTEACQPATSPFDIRIASSSVVFMIHAASWHEIYIHTYRQTTDSLTQNSTETDKWVNVPFDTFWRRVFQGNRLHWYWWTYLTYLFSIACAKFCKN